MRRAYRSLHRLTLVLICFNTATMLALLACAIPRAGRGPTKLLYVNVTMFGARGDGQSDDTDAFLRALASSPCIAIPPGQYCISRPIDIPAAYEKQSAIVGAGFGQTQLLFTGKGSFMRLSARGSVYVSGCTFRCVYRNQGTIALNLNRAEHSRITNNLFADFDTAVVLGTEPQGDAYFNVIEQNQFKQCTYCGVRLAGTPSHALPSNQNWVIHNKFQDCTCFGILAEDGCYACDFSFNNFEGTTQVGIQLDGNDNCIMLCHFEVGSQHTSIHIASGLYNYIVAPTTAGSSGIFLDEGQGTIIVNPRNQPPQLPRQL